jgi:transposase
MPAPYSEDLRVRVVAAIEGGMSCRRAAALFGLGASTVITWMKMVRVTGNVAAKPMGGDRNSRLKEEREWLLQRIADVPDLTREEIRAELKERGVEVGYGTVWRFYDSERVTVKKNRARGRARAA